ncbi:MAG TPA: DUF6293 family protein [Candidatus Nanoarchaeia archaeon]|nr:DUF6293 family protein [Candidatus Nanoarchaeia archaeon]
MKSVVIAPVGDNLEALFVGIKEFPTEKVFLIAPEDKGEDAEKARKELQRFGILGVVVHVSGNMMEEMFRVVAEIKKAEAEKSIVVNVATGDRLSSCIALSAAFVNGLKAFGVVNDQAMLLPILKFSYYKLLTERKIEILRVLNEKGPLSLEGIGTAVRMSLPLLSYHLNGTYKVDGLKQLGLVETVQQRGRMEVSLSQLGKLLVKGYIS